MGLLCLKLKQAKLESFRKKENYWREGAGDSAHVWLKS